jgi:hypothetical protein
MATGARHRSQFAGVSVPTACDLVGRPGAGSDGTAGRDAAAHEHARAVHGREGRRIGMKNLIDTIGAVVLWNQALTEAVGAAIGLTIIYGLPALFGRRRVTYAEQAAQFAAARDARRREKLERQRHGQR